jgi:uncharacterized protein (DUF1330 family)
MRMMYYSAGMIASFAVGMTAGIVREQLKSAPPADHQPRRAYLVASWDILSPPEELKPFSDAAVPLAQKAGLEMLAHAEPQVLEGEWPYKGVLIVQEYASMPALLDFWRSADHDAAKKLREGRIRSHFVVAVESVR